MKASNKKYKHFVGSWVAESRQKISTNDWEYIQRKGNIDDLVSTEINAKVVDLTNKWFSGPKWILYNKMMSNVKRSKRRRKEGSWN